MKTSFLKQIFLFVFLSFSFTFVQAQNIISGIITDEESTPLPSVNIVVAGTTEGTFTDFDGNFTLKTNQDFPFEIEISSVGFGLQKVTVSSADQEINVQLTVGQNLEEIIVSASRKPQKVQDAPASVSIISSRDIENASSSVVDPVRILQNIPGVTLQQQSANSLGIEMRAGSGLFGTSTFALLDYRYLVTPAAGTFLSYQTGISNLDIERVEVVRGSNSASFGPGVTSGVVHFLSKSAIDRPGTSVEAYVGELNTTGYGLRHAYSNEAKTFGYKINFNYRKGDDFTLDLVEDAAAIAGYAKTIYLPSIGPDGKINASTPGKILLGPSDTDPDGDGNPLTDNFTNYSANAHLEFRPSDDSEYVLAAGFANGGGLFFSDLGPGYTQGNDYWYQARMQRGGLFAQAYHNYNDGGSLEAPTFVYGTGLSQIAERSNTEVQIQYSFDLGSSEFLIGGDYRNVVSNSKNSLYGSNEENDPYSITGFYIQGETPLSNKLSLTYAGRIDKTNFYDESAFAPRVALVYKASPKHTFRASYNRANEGVTALQQYIDFPLLKVNGAYGSPGGIQAWLSGQANDQVFDSSSLIEVAGTQGAGPGGGPIRVPQNTPGVPLSIVYGASVANGVLTGLEAAFATNPLLAPVAPFKDALMGFFRGDQPALGLGTPYAGPNTFTGQLYPYALTDALGGGFPKRFESELWGQSKSKIVEVNSFEIGYSGIIGEKLKVGIDLFTYNRKGFTSTTNIGPTFGAVNVDFPGDLSQSVSADVLSSAALRNVVTAGATPGVTAGVTQAVDAQYAGIAALQGVDINDLNAGLIPGVPSRAIAIAGGVATQLAATVDAAMGGLAQAAAGAFTTAGEGFAGAAGVSNGFQPIFGAIEAPSAPDNDQWLNTGFGYRNYADATRRHWGADIDLQYYVNTKLSYYANLSWVNRNWWAVGDDDLPFATGLDSPMHKYRAGLDYIAGLDKGIRFNLSYQHDSAFNSDSALYGGEVQEKNLFDMNIGYQFDNGLRIDISGTNIFDNKYRAFQGMPVIGRRMIAKATYTF